MARYWGDSNPTPTAFMEPNMFTLTIETDNAAFEETPRDEIFAILEHVKARVLLGYDTDICRDTNGNRVGEWRLDL